MSQDKWQIYLTSGIHDNYKREIVNKVVPIKELQVKATRYNKITRVTGPLLVVITLWIT